MISGILPLEMLGADAWPAGVAAQIHYTEDDPHRRQDRVDAVAASVRAAGAPLHVFDYPAPGTCSPTAHCPTSTTQRRRSCCGSEFWPSAPPPLVPGRRRDRHRREREETTMNPARPARLRSQRSQGRHEQPLGHLRPAQRPR